MKPTQKLNDAGNRKPESGEHEQIEPAAAGSIDWLGWAGTFGVWLRSTFASLSVPNYRYFFIGQGISLIGTWVRRTALGWLVYQMTGSKALLGAVAGFSLLPLFLFSPIAGAIADRVDKRRLVIATQILATATSAALAALLFLDCIHIWQIMVLATLSGVAFAFEMPARQAFVVEMVGRDKLMNAIALNSALVNLSRIIGPAVAGVVMAWVGMGFCFALDALSYVVVTVTLLLLRLPRFRKPDIHASHWEHLKEGVREVLHNHRVGIVLLLLFVMGVFGWAFQTLMPAIARDLLKLGEFRYGLLMSVFGCGAIGGALFTASRKPDSNRRRLVFGGLWAMVAGTLLLSLTRSFWHMAPTLVLTGFGAVLFMSTGNTLIQSSVDDRIRGRVMGIWALAFGGSLPLGSFLSGAVAQFYSPFETIQMFSLVLLLSSVLIYFRLPKRTPDTPTVPAEPPAPAEAS